MLEYPRDEIYDTSQSNIIRHKVIYVRIYIIIHLDLNVKS